MWEYRLLVLVQKMQRLDKPLCERKFLSFRQKRMEKAGGLWVRDRRKIQRFSTNMIKSLKCIRDLVRGRGTKYLALAVIYLSYLTETRKVLISIGSRVTTVSCLTSWDSREFFTFLSAAVVFVHANRFFCQVA